jgi:hypothetical protein
MGFFLRWIFAFVLLVATYNPSFISYSSWVGANFSTNMPVAVLLGLVLIAGYLIYLRATLSSIGIVGMILILAIVGALLWVMFSVGVLQFGNPTVNGWIVIFALSIMLAVGMYWSVIWRRISGQVDVDEVDTN